MKTLRALFILGLIVIVGPAFAEVAAEVVATPLPTEIPDPSVWTVLNNALYTLTMALIPVIGTVIAVYVRKWLGDRAAQIAQAMFQAAAERGAAKALNEAGATEQAKPIGTPPAPSTIATGVDYLKATMPDTIKRLEISDQKLGDVIQANIGKLKITAGPIAAPVGPRPVSNR